MTITFIVSISSELICVETFEESFIYRKLVEEMLKAAQL